jgi:hypothetical protein
MSREQHDLLVQQLTIFVLALGLAVSSCAKVTPATPKAAAAIKADAVVVRVNELQAAVIDYCGPAPECAPNTIPTNTARDVVKALIDVRTTLKATPEGWQATVKAGWVVAKSRLVGITNPAIVAALSAGDALIGGL